MTATVDGARKVSNECQALVTRAMEVIHTLLFARRERKLVALLVPVLEDARALDD